MDKWITKNQTTIFKILAIVFVLIAILFAKFTNSGSLTACAIYVILVVLTFVALTAITVKTEKRLASIFSKTCDPTDLFDLYESMYKKNRKNFVCQINHSFVLSISGKRYELKAFLEGIDITKQKNTTLCFIYYNNLFDAYYTLNMQNEMEQAYLNALKCYDAIKNEKLKKSYENAINSLCLDYATAKGDVNKALIYIEKIFKDELLHKAVYSFCMAKINLLQNETEKAKEHLNFVIQNASKISLGQEAKELLEKISQ